MPVQYSADGALGIVALCALEPALYAGSAILKPFGAYNA